MIKYSDVVVIGAGAAGLLSGGLLAKEGLLVTILDKNKSVGRKLSATGNGRCNFTNRHMDVSCYYGDKNWVTQVLHSYSFEDAIGQFRDIGVWHREKDGYVYPHTNQAVTVVEALHNFCKSNGANLVLECKVNGVKAIDEEERYLVKTAEGDIRCNYVILATGGKASEELGGSGSGYKIARSLGHKILPLYPALTGCKAEGDLWTQVAGTRIQGKFSLWSGQECLGSNEGEIQIVKDGVSGIPVFQLCRQAAKTLAEGNYLEGEIDFIPSMSEAEVRDWLGRFGADGLVPKKWLPILKRKAEPEKTLKHFRFPILDTFGMERAQVTAGGVSTEEVSPETMESQLARGIFLPGEILDVDGICGGYNLHFAWAGATLAAREIIRRWKGKR